jgi:hypothetical protein
MMFDDIRDLSENSDLLEQGEGDSFEIYGDAPRGGGFMGLTAGQRLVLSILLLAVVVVMGLTCLLVTQRIWLP